MPDLVNGGLSLLLFCVVRVVTTVCVVCVRYYRTLARSSEGCDLPLGLKQAKFRLKQAKLWISHLASFSLFGFQFRLNSA